MNRKRNKQWCKQAEWGGSASWACVVHNGALVQTFTIAASETRQLHSHTSAKQHCDLSASRAPLSLRTLLRYLSLKYAVWVYPRTKFQEIVMHFISFVDGFSSLEWY